MPIEYRMDIHLFQTMLAIVLVVVNVMIFIDLRHGPSIARRGARGFAVAAFASALVALFAMKHLLVQIWIHPADGTAFFVLETAMTGMTLTTAGAVAFWVLSRWQP